MRLSNLLPLCPHPKSAPTLQKRAVLEQALDCGRLIPKLLLMGESRERKNKGTERERE